MFIPHVDEIEARLKELQQELMSLVRLILIQALMQKFMMVSMEEFLNK